MPSWLAGVAMSTTSVAVVYAVMVETGLNRHDLGKLILAACFITDLGTVLALGGLFASYGWLLPFFFLRAGTLISAPALVTGAGVIAALFGLTHHLITQAQYTELVTVVILSAFVPTLIAQQLFRPQIVDSDEEEALGEEDMSIIRHQGTARGSVPSQAE